MISSIFCSPPSLNSECKVQQNIKINAVMIKYILSNKCPNCYTGKIFEQQSFWKKLVQAENA